MGTSMHASSATGTDVRSDKQKIRIFLVFMKAYETKALIFEQELQNFPVARSIPEQEVENTLCLSFHPSMSQKNCSIAQ